MKPPQKGKGGGGGHLCLNKTASPQVIPPGEPEVYLGSKGPAFRNGDPSAAMNALPRHDRLAHCFVAATQSNSEAGKVAYISSSGETELLRD